VKIWVAPTAGLISQSDRLLGSRSSLHPYANFQYLKITTDGFTELNGGDFNLRVSVEDYVSVQTVLGVVWKYDFNKRFAVSARGSWMHEFGDKAAYINASLLNTPDTFRQKGLVLGADRFNGGVDFTAVIYANVLAYARADYSSSSGQKSQGASLGVRYAW
jgi:outer membrane autotransporter protein